MTHEYGSVPEDILEVVNRSEKAWAASGIEDPAQKEAFQKGFVCAAMGVVIEQVGAASEAGTTNDSFGTMMSKDQADRLERMLWGGSPFPMNNR